MYVPVWGLALGSFYFSGWGRAGIIYMYVYKKLVDYSYLARLTVERSVRGFAHATDPCKGNIDIKCSVKLQNVRQK